MLDFAIRRRLPALDEIDPQFWMGGIERQVRGKTKSMVNVGLGCVFHGILPPNPQESCH
jgi:hypothetical protein